MKGTVPTPEQEAEIRRAVVEIDDPLWPGLTESDWCAWCEDLLAAWDEARRERDEARAEVERLRAEIHFLTHAPDEGAEVIRNIVVLSREDADAIEKALRVDDDEFFYDTQITRDALARLRAARERM